MAQYCSHAREESTETRGIFGVVVGRKLFWSQEKEKLAFVVDGGGVS